MTKFLNPLSLFLGLIGSEYCPKKSNKVLRFPIIQLMYLRIFQAFQPSSWPYYWVPTKDEARNEALKVPFSPSVDTQLTNEIEFHKSNELLVPGTTKCFSTRRP